METRAEIIILSKNIHPRLEYVARFLSKITGIRFTASVPASSDDINNIYSTSGSFIINYNNNPIEGTFTVFAAGLLFETGIEKQDPPVVKLHEQHLLYPAPAGFDLPFDLFSAAFYLLSRYEEYLPFKPDVHGRFEADQSLAFRHGFLEKPVIDQWTGMLKAALMLKFPALRFPESKYSYVSTIDVDSPWAFLHKGPVRTFGGLLKALVILPATGFRLRMDVLRKKRHDPFDTFSYIREVEMQYDFRSLCFFLLGNTSKYDANYALETPHFKKLLQHVKTDHTIGIHPSYASNNKTDTLKHEFDRFIELADAKPEISRQHFLILRFPHTYRQLIAMGIKEDFSMGYASRPGFRAGTCTPFQFYDLEKECETNLVINPFTVMDVTYKHYLGMNPKGALESINRLSEEVRAVNGTFISLWHNESLSELGEWEGWRRVWEEMVGKRRGTSKTNIE